MKNKILQTIVNVLKEVFLIIRVIILVVFIFATLGLGIVLFDSVNKSEYNDDWELMEEWKQKEIKRLKKRIKK